MTRAQIVDLMRERGFTHAVTYGGPVPLDDWFPYGRQHALDYRGDVVSSFQVKDHPKDQLPFPLAPGDDAFVLGVWEFVRLDNREIQEVT